MQTKLLVTLHLNVHTCEICTCLLKYAYLPSKEVKSVSVFSQLDDTLMLPSDCLLSNTSALGLRAAPLRLGVTWISKHNNSSPCHWNQIFCSLALCNLFFISLCTTASKLHVLYFKRQTSNQNCFMFCVCNLVILQAKKCYRPNETLHSSIVTAGK